MNVSREFLIENLKTVRKGLGDWVRDLEDPEVILADGKKQKVYPNGVPRGTSVGEIQGIPVDQLRAELLAMAGILESLTA